MEISNPFIEKLGFKEGDRLVIFHADDVGMSRGSNQAFLELIDAGIVKTGSVMVPCPWAGEILAIAKERPSLDLGVHLTLTCEYDHYRWGPISSGDDCSSLVEPDGRFWKSVNGLALHVDPQEAAKEQKAQVAYVADLGVEFTHIDTHMGGSLIPQLAPFYVTLGAEHRVPPLLSKQHMIQQGRHEQIQQLESAGFPLVDAFRITLCYTENPPEQPTANAYEAVLKECPPGITYFSLHPNAPGDIEHISPRSADWRIFEYEYLQSDRLRNFLDEQDIHAIGYRELCTAMRQQTS